MICLRDSLIQKKMINGLNSIKKILKIECKKNIKKLLKFEIVIL